MAAIAAKSAVRMGVFLVFTTKTQGKRTFNA